MQPQNHLQTKLLNHLRFEQKTQDTVSKTEKILSQSVAVKKLHQIEMIAEQYYRQEDYDLAKEKAKTKLLETQLNQSLYEHELCKIKGTISSLRTEVNDLTTKYEQAQIRVSIAENNLSQLKKAFIQAKSSRQSIKQQDYPYNVEVERWVSTRQWFASGKWKSFTETRYGGPMYDQAIIAADAKLHQIEQKKQLAQKTLNSIIVESTKIASLLQLATEKLEGAKVLSKTIENNWEAAKILCDKAEQDVTAINIEDYSKDSQIGNEPNPITQAEKLIKLCHKDLEYSFAQKQQIIAQIEEAPAICHANAQEEKKLLGKDTEQD